MFAAGVLVLVGGVLFGTGVVASQRGLLIRHAPSSALLHIVQLSGGVAGSDALTELKGRLVRGDLSASQQDALIALALDVQGDLVPGIAWHPEWSELLHEALGLGLLSWEDEGRYYEQSVVYTPRIRDKVIAGREVYLTVEFAEVRYGSAHSHHHAVGPTVIGPPTLLDVRSPGESPSFPNAHPRGWGGTSLRHRSKTTALEQISIPAEFAGRRAVVHGRHTLIVGPPGTPFPNDYPGFDLTKDPPSGWWRWTRDFALEVEVLPAETEASELVSFTRATNQDGAYGVDASLEWIMPRGGGEYYVSVRVHHPTSRMAFDAFVRPAGSDGPGTKCGMIIAASPGGSYGVGFSVPQDIIGDADSVDIVLRPSIDAAYLHPEIDSILAVQIVFEGVQIPTQAMSRQRLEMKPTRVEAYSP